MVEFSNKTGTVEEKLLKVKVFAWTSEITGKNSHSESFADIVGMNFSGLNIQFQIQVLLTELIFDTR